MRDLFQKSITIQLKKSEADSNEYLRDKTSFMMRVQSLKRTPYVVGYLTRQYFIPLRLEFRFDRVKFLNFRKPLRPVGKKERNFCWWRSI